jgi:hypothetical protein
MIVNQSELTVAVLATLMYETSRFAWLPGQKTTNRVEA